MRPTIDIHKAVYYIISCRNFDGGASLLLHYDALSIAHSLHLLNVNDVGGADLLAWWLAERQCDSGGLNGRPEKQADVWYSWGILSACYQSWDVLVG